MSIPDELKQLYSQGLGWHEFFEALAKYQRPMAEITADRGVEISGLSYETIVTGLKQLAGIKVGSFKYGRRGGKTRLVWSYSPGSVGRVAQGKQDRLEPYFEENGF